MTSQVDIAVSGLHFDFGSEFPTIATALGQIIFFVVVEDAAFYLAHSTLHRPAFYWIHKKHHEYYHSIGIAAQYAHPVEFVLGNLVPFGLGAKFLGAQVHAATYLLWGILKLCETTEAHCGFNFELGVLRFLPFSGSSDFHNYHHSHNVGNYGVLTFWDNLLGTSLDYQAYQAHKG